MTGIVSAVSLWRCYSIRYVGISLFFVRANHGEFSKFLDFRVHAPFQTDVCWIACCDIVNQYHRKHAGSLKPWGSINPPPTHPYLVSREPSRQRSRNGRLQEAVCDEIFPDSHILSVVHG